MEVGVARLKPEQSTLLSVVARVDAIYGPVDMLLMIVLVLSVAEKGTEELAVEIE